MNCVMATNTVCLLQKLWRGYNDCLLQKFSSLAAMNYVSTRMGYHFSALLSMSICVELQDGNSDHLELFSVLLLFL